MDKDTDLIIYTDLASMPKVKCAFNKANSSIFELHTYIMSKVLGKGGVKTAVSSSKATASAEATVACWLTDDARQVDAGQLEASLKTPEQPVLVADEVVVLAFRSGRDSVVLTDRRYMKVDVQGSQHPAPNGRL
eukprot:2395285-Amphidinium_carterae.1